MDKASEVRGWMQRRVEAPKRVDDSGLRQHLGYQLRRAEMAMQQRFSLQIGVPFRLRQIEFFALTLLATNRALTHKQISLALAIAPSNMVGIMAALEERDLVMRQANPSDGRSFFWCLTVAGDELLERAKTAVARMEAGALADTESAREELTNGLDELWSREPSF